MQYFILCYKIVIKAELKSAHFSTETCVEYADSMYYIKEHGIAYENGGQQAINYLISFTKWSSSGSDLPISFIMLVLSKPSVKDETRFMI